jgi:hypothetical protein
MLPDGWVEQALLTRTGLAYPASEMTRRLCPSTDVLPITEFHANTSTMLRRLHATKRPVILTQHGRGEGIPHEEVVARLRARLIT